MFARILKPEECWKCYKIQSIAFDSPFDEEKEKAECAKPKEPVAPAADGLPEESRGVMAWVSGEGDELYSAMEMFPFPTRFDGHVVLMGGVGGVATLPQYRRMGAVRVLMQEALRDLYEHDYMLSMLYPFSSAYYRQFGYASGTRLATWTVPLSGIKLPDVGGSMQMLNYGDDLSVLTKLYNDCCADWNLSVVRRVFDEDLIKENFMKKARHIYVWRNNAGEPRGFIILKKVDKVLECTFDFDLLNAVYFRDAEALTAILRFATSFQPRCEQIRFCVPDGLHIESLVANDCDAKCELQYSDMVRVVNVRKALEMCRCRGEGSVRISVTDAYIPKNCGVWQVDFVPGQPNRVQLVDAPADVEMRIDSFSQLILGIRTADDLPMMPELTVHNPSAPLHQIFYKKMCWLTNLV